jgi:hypothetical protein
MTDLETKLAEARERLREEMKANNPGIESFSRLILWGEGFDAAVAACREEIDRLYSLSEVRGGAADAWARAAKRLEIFTDELKLEITEKDAEIARLEAEVARWKHVC